jgi:hypothetical protein
LTAPDCSLSLGICQNAKKTCGTNGWIDCSQSNYGTNYEILETSCDSQDNDCDGDTDAGCSCTNANTQTCGATDVGECSFGTQTCNNGQWGTCEGSAGSKTETCDGKDNDCDGTVDEEACSGSGGGSSGGPSGCIENWECEEWAECKDENKERACQDINNCGTEQNMPMTSAKCDDECADGMKNNDENGIDCGGSCTVECLTEIEEEPIIEPDITNKIEAMLTEESTKASKVIVKYDNTGEGRKTGVEFNLEIADKQGKIVAEEYFGPVAIDENKKFIQEYNMPLYLLSKNQEYDLTMEVTEKGKTTTKITSNIILSYVPNKVFFSRVNFIFVSIIIFILVVIVFFSMLFSRGEKK